MEKEKNYFEKLYEINVNEKIEKKNGLNYLSWAWAWAEVKKLYPEANYKIYERENGINYWTDGKTAWVKTGVTINGIEHIEYLPIMDYRNKSIPLENITSFDVNKTIQRSLTKAVARHGLGLYIYAGEDLPESEEEVKKENKNEKIDYHKLLVLELKKRNINIQEFAKQNKLNANSPQEKAKKILEELIKNDNKKEAETGDKENG